jgi:mRNA-degrading endonuclease toxin of MazEF toxin-antitoxin module
LLKEDYPFFNYAKNIVLCEEGRSISKKRLERFLGKISDEDLDEILQCKEYVFIEKK